MELTEKVLNGIESCMDGTTGCNGCPYRVGDELCCYSIEKLMRDSQKVIRGDAGEIERLRAQVFNLTLFLRYVEFADRDLFGMMEATYGGLPGYCPKILGGETDEVRNEVVDVQPE